MGDTSPQGIGCPNHPDQVPTRQCPSCSQWICEECVVHVPNGFLCRTCYAPQREPAPAVEPPVVGPYLAWEDRSKNVFARFWSTWSQVVTKPQEFYTQLPQQTGTWPVVTYYLMLQAQLMAPVMICMVPAFLVMGIVLAVAPTGPGQAPPPFPMWILPIVLLVGMPIVIFVTAILSIWIPATAVHAGLLLLGGRTPMETTVRAVGYAVGTVMLASMIPYIGPGCIIPIWLSILVYYAGIHTFRLSQERAMILASIPAVLALTCAVSSVAVGMLGAILDAKNK